MLLSTRKAHSGYLVSSRWPGIRGNIMMAGPHWQDSSSRSAGKARKGCSQCHWHCGTRSFVALFTAKRPTGNDWNLFKIAVALEPRIRLSTCSAVTVPGAGSSPGRIAALLGVTHVANCRLTCLGPR